MRYDQSGSRYRHHKSLREYVGIRVLDVAGETWLHEQALQAAQTKQELPDIINVLIEELIQRRFELPGFTQLFRLARNARATVNDRIYKAVAGALPAEVVGRARRAKRHQPALRRRAVGRSRITDAARLRVAARDQDGARGERATVALATAVIVNVVCTRP